MVKPRDGAVGDDGQTEALERDNGEGHRGGTERDEAVDGAGKAEATNEVHKWLERAA